MSLANDFMKNDTNTVKIDRASEREFEAFKRKVNESLSELSFHEQTLEQEKQNLEVCQSKIDDCQQAILIAQDTAQRIQSLAHEQIASIVSKCLSTVFDDPYEFKILFEKKRNKTEARMIFERNGVQVDPVSAAGGGVVDVASLALRIVCVLMQRPLVRRILILDEPFRFVSRDRQEKVAQLLEEISKELGFQIILVTHDTELEVGKVIKL